MSTDRPLAVMTGIDLACRITLIIGFSIAIGGLAYVWLRYGLHAMGWA